MTMNELNMEAFRASEEWHMEPHVGYFDPKPSPDVTVWADHFNYTSLQAVAEYLDISEQMEKIRQDGFHNNNLWQWSEIAKLMGKIINLSNWGNGEIDVAVTFWPDGQLQFNGGYCGHWFRHRNEKEAVDGKFPKRLVLEKETYSEE